MARKDPYRTVAVRRKILGALEPLRLKASEGELRPYSMNAFCEQILWDYSQGKIGKLTLPLEGRVDSFGTGPETVHTDNEENLPMLHLKKSEKQPHRRTGT